MSSRDGRIDEREQRGDYGMFKKYGKLIFLVVLLLITTEITMYVNKDIDSKLSNDQNEKTVEKLRIEVDKSTAKAEGLNPYRDFWLYELEYFSTDYPKVEKEMFENIDMEAWNESFHALKEKISTEYIDDVTFMSEVSATIKEYISINYIEDIFDPTYKNGYFRSVMMLMEDDQKKSQVIQ